MRRLDSTGRHGASTILPALLLTIAVVALPLASPGARGAAKQQAAKSGRLLVFSGPNNITYWRPLAGGRPRILRPPSSTMGAANPDAPDSYSWSRDGKYLMRSIVDGVDCCGSDFFLYNGQLSLISPRNSKYLSGDGGTWATSSDRAVISWFAPKEFEVVTAPARVRPLWPHKQKWNGSAGGGPTGYRSSDDPAEQLRLVDVQSWQAPFFWIDTKLTLVYQPESCKPWAYPLPVKCFWVSRNTHTGRLTKLPFLGANFSSSNFISPSPNGLLAGQIQNAVIVTDLRGRRLHSVGPGYAPKWSASGLWLYYVTARTIRTLRLKLWCSKSGHGCRAVTSPVKRVSIVRVRPNGSGSQVVTSQLSYAFENVDVLPDGTVFFDDVPSDLNLWLHRDQPLTASRIAKYGPGVRIEEASPGRAPTVVIPNGSLPAVQP